MLFIYNLLMTIRQQLNEHLRFWEKFLEKKFCGNELARMLTRIRDDFTCQVCGRVRTPEDARDEGKRMFDVHHVGGNCGKGRSYSYDSVKDLWRLITLCHRCHFKRDDHTIQMRQVIS